MCCLALGRQIQCECSLRLYETTEHRNSDILVLVISYSFSFTFAIFELALVHSIYLQKDEKFWLHTTHTFSQQLVVKTGVFYTSTCQVTCAAYHLCHKLSSASSGGRNASCGRRPYNQRDAEMFCPAPACRQNCSYTLVIGLDKWNITAQEKRT